MSLNTVIDSGDGNEPSELMMFIADDKALDFDAWLDARRILLVLPRRLVQIGYKRYAGIPLDGKDREYLRLFLKKTQKPLF